MRIKACLVCFVVCFVVRFAMFCYVRCAFVDMAHMTQRPVYESVYCGWRHLLQKQSRQMITITSTITTTSATTTTTTTTFFTTTSDVCGLYVIFLWSAQACSRSRKDWRRGSQARSSFLCQLCRYHYYLWFIQQTNKHTQSKNIQNRMKEKSRAPKYE